MTITCYINDTYWQNCQKHDDCSDKCGHFTCIDSIMVLLRRLGLGCSWFLFFFFFSNNAHILLQVMSCMAEVHEEVQD